MPPGPAYNWFCVLHSTVEILAFAARHRAPKTVPSYANPHKRRRTETSPESSPDRIGEGHDPSIAWTALASSQNVVLKELPVVEETALGSAVSGKLQDGPAKSVGADTSSNGVDSAVDKLGPSRVLEFSKSWKDGDIIADTIAQKNLRENDAPSHPKSMSCIDHGADSNSKALDDAAAEPVVLGAEVEPSQAPLRPGVEHSVTPNNTQPASIIPDIPQRVNITEALYPAAVSRNLQSSKVPSSRIGRLFHYGGLAASLGYGAASEILRRTGTESQAQTSVMMTEANIKRLVSKLSQMRGAALKLGQFMSIQDTHILPPDIDKIFRRVQDSAHYMPDWQMEQVMTSALGSSWKDNFTSFERMPFAAASIGQVHTAVLAAAVSPSGRDERVAVKIQFPNIANSIDSDLGYIKLLLTAGKLLPRGLFLDKTIQAMKTELADECDYVREASFLRSFGSAAYLGNDPRFKVPWVWDGSTSTVLVMERVVGVSVGEATAQNLTREDRDDISARIIELCLKELFEFRAMQTDPNWTNFLWNPQSRQVELVDFGATRTYSKEFIDSWFSILQAATTGNRDSCIEWSLKIGYLTGEENQLMLDAHVNSMTLLATPFKPDTIQPFSFGQGTQWADITSQIRAQIPVMLQHRLTAPPKETYSLNRKLSGSFLLASRLGATIDTRAIWNKVVGQYFIG